MHCISHVSCCHSHPAPHCTVVCHVGIALLHVVPPSCFAAHRAAAVWPHLMPLLWLVIYSPVQSGFFLWSRCNQDQTSWSSSGILQRPDQDRDQLVYISPLAATQPVATGLFGDWLITSLNWFISGCNQFSYVHTSRIKMMHIDCK